MKYIDKHTLYDWFGYNQVIFKWVNQAFSSPAYDSGMLFLAHTFDVKNYPYFMGVLVAYALLIALWHRMRSRNDARSRYFVPAWIGSLSVLAVGFVSMGLVIKTMKAYFSFPRPYVVFPKGDIRVLDAAIEAGKDYHSFPSGHAAFATLMVAGLWPVLSKDMRAFGFALVALVCWSRMAVGVHFPADVLASVLVVLVVVDIVKCFVYWLLETLFGLRC